MDCSIQPTRIPDVFSVQTTDFFYPLVDDPYTQGKVGCANVLSDLYAMGISECDNMLMILAGSRDMPKHTMELVTKEMMRGFNDLAREAGTKVTGGQSVMNPWPIIGGVATSTCLEKDFIRPENAQPGDVLVLTKPLVRNSPSMSTSGHGARQVAERTNYGTWLLILNLFPWKISNVHTKWRSNQ